jgi:hypothetical protein
LDWLDLLQRGADAVRVGILAARPFSPETESAKKEQQSASLDEDDTA